MMDLLMRMAGWALVVFGTAVAAWSLRCAFGWHGEPMAESMRDPASGKRIPHVLQWRCTRCHRVLPARSELRPKTALLLSLHRDRKAKGRVLIMKRKA